MATKKLTSGEFIKNLKPSQHIRDVVKNVLAAMEYPESFEKKPYRYSNKTGKPTAFHTITRRTKHVTVGLNYDTFPLSISCRTFLSESEQYQRPNVFKVGKQFILAHYNYDVKENYQSLVFSLVDPIVFKK